MTRLYPGRLHGGSSATRGGTPALPTGPRQAGHRLMGTLAIAAAVALLAGCTGTSTPAKAPTSTPAATPSGTPTATRTGPVPPTRLGYTPADPDRIGAWAVMGRYSARSPEEQLSVQVWTAFAQAMMEAINRRTIDFKVLDSIATGNARNDVLTLIGERAQKGMFTVGPLYVVIQDVQLTGTSATITYCQNVQSYEVDDHGKAVTPPAGVASGRDTLVKVNGRWLVSSEQSTPGGCPTPTVTP
jgi:hypothetical protein